MNTAPPPDSYSAFERTFIGPFRQGMLRATRPVVAVLAAAGVPPNAVSASQIPLGFAVLWLVPLAPAAAFGLFLLTLLADGIDGALARSTGRASPFGALVDQYCDHIREVTVVAGMAAVGPLHPLPAVLYGLIYIGVNFTLYLANAYGAPVAWAVKSYMVVYPALGLYLLFGVDLLTPAVTLSEGLMLVVIGMGMRNLGRAMGAPPSAGGR
ncbi:MAG: CDP-alcohol phosphatidyltransferase family protein [Chloroflexi bacterium]|nr:CDP-alcohol phosphatidyltransferase family protein [Chloroflexota bacterium]